MSSVSEMDEMPAPLGELTLQAVAMPKDTNASGDIFGGWLVSQMDLAGLVAAERIAKGRVATVAIDEMTFMVPVKVGAVVSCFTRVMETGRSSIHVQVEVWAINQGQTELHKVTEGQFVFVALTRDGNTRAIPT